MIYNNGSMHVDMNDILKKLILPEPDSHKGQNGRLLLIGGSHLFHAASLWSLTVASRIVDLVHYSSVPENNEIVQKAKGEFRNGIVIPRSDIEDYIREDDAILIGPGMTRDDETRVLTNTLLRKYPEKQWVIDAGALQMLDPENIPPRAILTPHHQEFESLLDCVRHKRSNDAPLIDDPLLLASQYGCIVLLKGQVDIASNGEETVEIAGGNEGMTKGGTGDVLAGLIAALACKSDPWIATLAGSYINKRAGDELYEKVGPFFNATDLADQIPKTMRDMIK